MFSRTQHLLSLTTSLVVFCVAVSISPADAADASNEEIVGYYPTFEESGILATGDYDYLRSQGGPLNGPDLDRWAATGGIWPYEYESGGLSKVQRFFQPVDYILRPITPGETIVIQGPTSESWLQLAGSFPFLSRTYHRERSHLSDLLGMENTANIPFFFDVLNVSFAALYVDASGPGFDESGLEDGFLGALSFGLRAGLAITDRTSLLIAGEVYFIFGDDGDVQAYADAGGLSALASIHYQEQIGSWDIHIFDDVTPFSYRQILYQETYTGDGIQSSGTRRIGIQDGFETSSWWNSRQHYLVNSAGLTAGTFLGESWRFLAGAGRVDSWLWNDWDEHTADEYVNAGLFYDGYGSWVAPSLTYQMHTQDFSDAQHNVQLNLVAPITSNITATAGVGYEWGEFYEGWDWNAGLLYQQTDRLRHTLAYSSGYQDATVGDDFIGTRLEYGVNYQLGSRITLGGYAGWFNSEDVAEDVLHIGGSALFALGNYSRLVLLAGVIESQHDRDNSPRRTDWLYSATLSRQLLTRLNAELAYEYLDSDTSRYKEHMVMLRLTRTF